MEEISVETERRRGEAAEIERQFLRLQAERRGLERQWQLDLDFAAGRQYCRISGSGEIVETEKNYEWEQRRVFNHIAPIVDTRLSKLSRIRPALAVRAASAAEGDRAAAKLSSAILSAVWEDKDMESVISRATMWSEICGTAFYKVMWDPAGGRKVGLGADGGCVREGDVAIKALSPFGIYPYSLTEEELDRQRGLIHASVLPVGEIYSMYGIKLAGKPRGEFAFPAEAGISAGEDGGTEENFELVLERYELPTADCPEGRLSVAAGGELLFDGALPYVNGADGTRRYPFIKQISAPVPGAFFGASVVERLIPVQRAFNAVKNRKHEYLNRIAMGAVAVEDGSVDVEELAEDGLAPGKIIVYRQGSNPPEMLTLGSVPEEFWKEEECLLNEFIKISGVNELSERADSFAGVTSATGLQLILEQDDDRLNVAYQSLKSAIKALGRQILRLFGQFAAEGRLMRLDDGGGERRARFFRSSDIASDDVVLEADTDLNMTPAQRRTLIFELLDKGLLSDDAGRISAAVKKKILGMLGYPSLAEYPSQENLKGENDD